MIKLGLISSVRDGDYDSAFARIKNMGFSCVQLSGLPSAMTRTDIENIIKAREKYGLETPSFGCGMPGPAVWDFYDGNVTLGLVPVMYRERRVRELVEAAPICDKLGVKNIIYHSGYIPENPLSELYHEIIANLRYICGIYKKYGIYFCFETGQETPVTLLRVIEDVGTGNLGINFDTANLILYGKANSVDALDIIGKYVRCMHAKDGEYPTNGRELGLEKPIGKGRANFPALIAKLKELGYDGSIVIEREIAEGPERDRDILESKTYLERLISQ